MKHSFDICIQTSHKDSCDGGELGQDGLYQVYVVICMVSLTGIETYISPGVRFWTLRKDLTSF